MKIQICPIFLVALLGFSTPSIFALDKSHTAANPAAHPDARQFFMIGHAHIDPVWRWTKDEGYQEVFASFRSALDRMNEFPGVSFVASSAQFYEWVEKDDPAMFAEIKQRVKEGRWNIVGGWWIEPDLNCPSGESLVRQGLYGQKFFMEKFGRKVRIGFNPDSFGHPWTLPQILKLQGLEAYFFMRPNIREKPDLPAPIFKWVGPDGSEILAVQILSSYNADSNSIENKVEDYVERFNKDLPDIQDYALFYGIGNHGGGPTIAAIQKIIELSSSKYPHMKFGTLEKYIDLIRPLYDTFPKLDDELQHHARGCYSACADVKMWNRQAESALLLAEKISSLTSILLKNSYPTDEFHASWKKVLFNQFHDILAGSSIEQGYVEAQYDYGYAMTTAKDATCRALHHLAQSIHTADAAFENSTPFVVFNPCSWPVKTPMEIEMQRLVRDVTPVLRDAGGKQVPYQEIRTAGVKVDRRIRILFQTDVPSLGYQIYRLDFSGKEKPLMQAGVKVDKWALENDWVRVSFDPITGYISSYFDKKNGRELLNKPAAVPLVMNDWDDTWGHRIVAYDQEVGRFEKATLTMMEEGSERGRIQVKSFYGSSFVVQDFALHRDSPELGCRVTVDWHEHYRVLKLGFPISVSKGELTYSIPYGFIEREMDGEEEPGQTWIDVSGSDAKGAFGVALLNDSKYGYSVKDGEIRLTVLHSTAWSDHTTEVFEEADGYRFMEQGIHEFTYCLVPHAGDFRHGDIARKAEGYLTPPVRLLTTNHAGKLAKRDAFISVSAPNVSVTVVKMSEKGDALVLRCVELHGKEAKGKIDIKPLGKAFDFTMKPCEIKTYLVPLEKNEQVKVVNALEE
ncbi:MAG TPA: glycoside hydrolase family 38 C-terminal domain-containing protein [archaeon]|nr:glycoside hydrolase family 38 C-terminal domain-containing protein [archaeon]